MNRVFAFVLLTIFLYNIIWNAKENKDGLAPFIAKNFDYLSNKVLEKTVVEKKMRARLTVYWAKGGETDGDSARKRSSSGTRLREGVSVAVDPRLIPFYKRLYIPNLGIRVAHDTGTAVKEKKASGGKLPVIDVFFEKKRDALDFAYNNPKIVTVSIYKY